MLLAKGYPDIGWNPIEGERYLSFLRFAVFVNGKNTALISSSTKVSFLSIKQKNQTNTSFSVSRQSIICFGESMMCSMFRDVITYICAFS